MTVQLSQQDIGVGRGRLDESLGQARRHRSAYGDLRERVDPRQTTEVSGDPAGAEKRREQLFEPSQGHGYVSRQSVIPLCLHLDQQPETDRQKSNLLADHAYASH
jgi:hypothetical protein